MPEQIPLIPSEFNYRVNTIVDGSEFIIDIRWNSRESAWYMDLYDIDEDPIFSGYKIVLGSLIGASSTDPRMPAGAFVASDLSNEGIDAGFNDLGTRVFLYFYSVEELT